MSSQKRLSTIAHSPMMIAITALTGTFARSFCQEQGGNSQNDCEKSEDNRVHNP